MHVNSVRKETSPSRILQRSSKRGKALVTSCKGACLQHMCMHGLTLSALPQDVTSQEDGRLIGRAFVSAATLTTLQGSISATLMSPQLELVCVHTRSHLNFAHSCPIFHASGQLVVRQPGSRARGQVITACVDGPLCQQQHHDRIHHRHVDVPSA